MGADIAKLIVINAVVVGALAALMWRIAVRINDPSFIDVCWGVGFVVVASVSFALNVDGTSSTRQAALLGLTSLWGLRLGGYLLWRWRKTGPDARYVAMLKRATNPAMFMLTRVFLLQAALLLLVSLPVQLGQVYDATPGWRAVNLVGAALAVFGIVFESAADVQLVRFKAKPANAGKVMCAGLWRYTRHPNYFGDFCLWWGIFLLSIANPVTLAGVVGPVVMSFLLMRYSGVGPLERQLHRRKPDYAEYVARTSGFFPRPPRRPATMSS